jgi:hypothetical protein
MNNLSTLSEVVARGQIFQICPSSLRNNTFIVIFALGDQCNIDTETYYKLTGA